MDLRNVFYINSAEPSYLSNMGSKGEKEVQNYSQISRLCNRMDGNTFHETKEEY